MNVILTLVFKHFLESRWVLGLSSAAFFGLGFLTNWLTQRFERLIELGEIMNDPRRMGMLRGFGGSAMDYSTTAMMVMWWNHPVIVLTVLSWAISRGAAAVAAEIERGTVDLTLSRPVSRPAYLTSQVLFAVAGLVALAFALILGSLVGSQFYTLKTPPTPVALFRPAAMLVALGMSVYGYTIPFSCVDVVRWRPVVIGSAVTLAGLVGMSVAPQFEGYDWLENFSVFQMYAPVTVAVKGEPLAYNSAVLTLVFAVGVAVSFWLFARRDLPSNS